LRASCLRLLANAIPLIRDREYGCSRVVPYG
jgi:hypothetical protein